MQWDVVEQLLEKASGRVSADDKPVTEEAELPEELMEICGEPTDSELLARIFEDR